MEKKIEVAVLGSTGSIGRQTLDVIERHRDLFSVNMLTANNNIDLLIEQTHLFDPDCVVVTNPDKYPEVKRHLAGSDTKVYCGMDSVCDILENSTVINTVVASMVGFNGLKPAISALKSGKRVALANKETMVSAGSLIRDIVKQYDGEIIPVDSEHSAIFQCIRGEHAEIEKIILTASGGPFLNTPAEQMMNASIEDALNHPKWKMGAKVTIDSATMMNKGLEMIEARWLFDIAPERIEIVVHPQSLIHSMVQFTDGAILAQMSLPDMRIPILYALSFPYRISLNSSRMDFGKLTDMTFLLPDREKFPCIGLAYSSIERGGNIPCAMNGANEVAVEAFLSGKIPFYRIPDIIEKSINKIFFIQNPTLDDIFGTDYEVRKIASELV